jgi:prohibitin 1
MLIAYKLSFMKPYQLSFFIAAILLLGTSCTVIRQGEVGVKRKVGKLEDNVYQPGPVGFNPLTTTVLKVSVQTENIEVTLDLPSKEGLTIRSQISILYHIEPNQVPSILQNIGMDYENTVILSVFRSAAADVTARFMAKEMHTSQRAVIEQEIKEAMQKILIPRGFIVEAVLLKSIQLPSGLTNAIQSKMEAEQQAQQMEFEAEGLRDAQKIISEGLNDFFIRWKSLEVFKELSKSPGSRVIITDGKTPLLIDPGETKK